MDKSNKFNGDFNINDRENKLDRKRLKKRAIRRKKMKRRRILFYIIVIAIIIIIFKIISSLKSNLESKKIEDRPNTVISWYINEINRQSKGIYTQKEEVFLSLKDRVFLPYEASLHIEKRLLPGSNHLISADKYAYDTAEIRSYIRGEKTYTGADKLVFLTFDDGPNNTITPQVLNILEKNNIHATFFVVGKSITDKTSSVLRRTIMEGHSIGIHSFTHDYDILYPNRIANVDKLLEENRLTIGRLQKIFGEDFKPTPWRYPGGHMSWQNTNESDAALKEIGLEWMDWNSLSGDGESKKTRPTTVEEGLNFVVKSLNKNLHSDVAVVLMHDAINKQLTVDTLQSVIDYFKENNYKFCILK